MPSLVLVTFKHMKELMVQINSRDVAKEVKHSHISVFLKYMNELRNPINISNVGLPSPFPVFFFDMTVFTLMHNPMHVHNGEKSSHIPVLLKNFQNSQQNNCIRKARRNSSLISVISNMDVLTLERKFVSVSIMKLSVFIPFTFKKMK
jgi:hypothetical protein